MCVSDLREPLKKVAAIAHTLLQKSNVCTKIQFFNFKEKWTANFDDFPGGKFEILYFLPFYTV